MADHPNHGHRPSYNSRHIGDTSRTGVKHLGADQNSWEVPRNRNVSPRYHKKDTNKLDKPTTKYSHSNVGEQQREDHQNVAIQASEFHIVTETGFPFFERNHSPKRNQDKNTYLNQLRRSSIPSPSPKKTANVQVGTSPDRVRLHRQSDQEQRRTRSPTTVQKCFGPQKEITDNVHQTGDSFPEKLTKHITEHKGTQEPEKPKRKDQSRSTGRSEARKKNHDTMEKFPDQKSNKKGDENSFLKLRRRGDVKSEEESDSELVLEDRNFLHMPKNREREKRAHRREDGSNPRQRSPYSTQQRALAKHAVSETGMKQGQGDLPSASRSKDGKVPTSRKSKFGFDDYKYCLPGRKRRLSYSPKVDTAYSGYRSTSPESLRNSPVRSFSSRSPSPPLRLRTAGVKKPLERASGVQVKASSSLGPTLRTADQLDTVGSWDRNASPTTTRTASYSEMRSDLIQELPERITKGVENVEYQRASNLSSDESKLDEDDTVTYQTSLTGEDTWRGHTFFPQEQEQTDHDSQPSYSEERYIRRSRSRSRRTVHQSRYPQQRPNDYMVKVRRSSYNESTKQIPAPIFLNSHSGRQNSPDHTFWVSSSQIVPNSHVPVQRTRELMQEVDMNYGSRGTSRFETGGSQRTLTTDFRRQQDLRQREETGNKVFSTEKGQYANFGLPNSVVREQRPLTLLERQRGINSASSTSTSIRRELGEDMNRRSSQGDSAFPAKSPTKCESVPRQEIKNEVNRSGRDLFAPMNPKDEEKSFEDKTVVDHPEERPTENLVKSQSLDESQRVKKSDSLVISKILRMHSSQKSLKDEEIEVAVKPIVFPSLVTGPAVGQGTKASDISPIKKSSAFSLQVTAFNPSAQNRSNQRKPTPGRSPPPGCAPSFSSGPGGLRDFRPRAASRSPSPKKSVFTTLRSREYENRIMFRTSRKPATEDTKKPETKSTPSPCPTESVIFKNAKDSEQKISLKVEEPKPSATLKAKENDSKPSKRTVKRSNEKADEVNSTDHISPPPTKIPRTSIENVTVGEPNDDTHSNASGRHSSKTVTTVRDVSESEVRKKRAAKRKKISTTENQVTQAGNGVDEEQKNKEHQELPMKAGKIKSVDQVISDEVFSKKEVPQPPKTQTTSTQYEPMHTSTLDNLQYQATEWLPERPHSVARLGVKDNVEQIINAERYDLLEENRRRSHSDSSARHNDRCHERNLHDRLSRRELPTMDHVHSPANDRCFRAEEREYNSYQNEPRPHQFYSPPVSERSPVWEYDDGIRRRIEKRRSTPPSTPGNYSRSSRSPEKNVELRERVILKEIPTKNTGEDRRTSVKFQTPMSPRSYDNNDYELGAKRHAEFEDTQQTRSNRISSMKKHQTRESSSDCSASSSLVRTVEQRDSTRPISQENLKSSRARDFRDEEGNGRNPMDDTRHRKTRYPGSRDSPEPRESRSSPPTLSTRHSKKGMAVTEKLPSVSTEDVSSHHQKRNRISDRVDRAKTKKILLEKHAKQEVIAQGDLRTPSMEDLPSIPDVQGGRDRTGKAKTRIKSSDNHGNHKGEDDKDSRNKCLMDIEEITSQVMEAEAELRKSSDSQVEADGWSREKWEKTVEEIMMRLKERERSPRSSKCPGSSKQSEGRSSCCKNQPHDSGGHEIIYVVETPADKEIPTAAKNRATSPTLKPGSILNTARRKSQSPVAEQSKRPLKDPSANTHKNSKTQASDLQKSAKTDIQSGFTAASAEPKKEREEETAHKQYGGRPKVSDPIDFNFTVGNKKLSGEKSNEPSSTDSGGSESLLRRFSVGDEKSKIEVLGNPGCGPCNTRRKRNLRDGNSLTSNLSNPQKRIIENLFGLEISIAPDEETSTEKERNRPKIRTKTEAVDVSNHKVYEEQRKNNLSVDQMLQMGLMSPFSNHNLHSDLPPVDKPGSVLREEDILKDRLESGCSDPKNREQFIIENGVLLQLKLDKLKRQQKAESIEKLSKLSFEQAMLKAEMNRREKIRAMAAGRERRDRSGSSQRTSPLFPGTSGTETVNARPNRSIDDMLKAEKLKTSKKTPSVEHMQLLRRENKIENTCFGGITEVATTLDEKINRFLESIKEKGKRKEPTSKCEKSIRSPGPTVQKCSSEKRKIALQGSKNREFFKEVLPLNMERLRVKSDNFVLKLRRRDQRIRKNHRTTSI